MKRLHAGIASLLVGAVAAVLSVAPAGAAPNTKKFCKSVRAFNATPPETTADLVASLKKLEKQAPKKACKTRLNLKGAVPTGSDSDGSAVKPAEWIGAVCSSVSSFKSDVDNLNAETNSTIGSITSLEDGRNLLVKFIGSVGARTDQLVSDLQAAGTPAVKDGAAVAQYINDGVASLRGVFSQSEQDAAALSTTDTTAFQTETTRIGQSITDAGTRLDELFAEAESSFDVPELDHAFIDEPACKAIGA